MVATNVQIPNVEALGKLSPGGEVIIFLHPDKCHIGMALCVWQEGVFTRVLAVVQNLGLTEQPVNFHFISFFLQTVYIPELDTWDCVELVLLEVGLMKVAIHVEAHDAKVVGSGNIRDDALTATALFRHPHPHVPVPQLFWCGPLGLKLLLV